MGDYPVVTAVPGIDPRMRVYIHTQKDLPGVVATNNFLSVLNPVGSGVLAIALQTIVNTYASAVTTVNQSLHVHRITAHSGGTLVAANTLPRFFTPWPDPVAQVRINNPTVTTTGLHLAAFPPVISTGTGSSSTTIGNPPGASFVMLPGEGLTFQTDAGDVDQIWNITYVWAETTIDSVEG